MWIICKNEDWKTKPSCWFILFYLCCAPRNIDRIAMLLNFWKDVIFNWNSQNGCNNNTPSVSHTYTLHIDKSPFITKPIECIEDNTTILQTRAFERPDHSSVLHKTELVTEICIAFSPLFWVCVDFRALFSCRYKYLMEFSRLRW